MGAEMSQEQQETNGSRNDGLNKENLMNNHEPFFRREEQHLNKMKLGVTVGCDGLIAINDHDETSFG